MQLKFYLVIQWTAAEMTLDELIEAETVLESRLALAGLTAKFSGNDIGANEMNIFIRCNDPVAVFGVAKIALEQRGQFTGVRAAYRLSSGEDYTAVWPVDIVDFEVS